LLAAEEMITDEYALNKKGDKLNRYYDKFRAHTIDSVYSIFKSIDVYLNGFSTTGAVVSGEVKPTPVVFTPVVEKKVEPAPQPLQKVEVEGAVTVDTSVLPSQPAQVEPATIAGTTMTGYKQIAPDKIPGNIIKLLGDWTLITSGTADLSNVMTAGWGGLGTFLEKPVSFCFINPEHYSIQTMDKGETYTISFYTEAYKDALRYCGSVSGRDTDKIKGSGLTPIKTPSGATAFAEAWMIFECKKIVAQPVYKDAVVDKSLTNNWNKEGYHKMYIGEIVNVWIK
jgi:flavin reductase (DIM6/NTAB) family NADH-FMN oxidoreductase RutF